MFRAYSAIREIRGKHIGGLVTTHRSAGKDSSKDAALLAELANQVIKNNPGEWLIGLELLELASQRPALSAAWAAPLREVITCHAQDKGALSVELLARGIELLKVVD